MTTHQGYVFILLRKRFPKYPRALIGISDKVMRDRDDPLLHNANSITEIYEELGIAPYCTKLLFDLDEDLNATTPYLKRAMVEDRKLLKFTNTSFPPKVRQFRDAVLNIRFYEEYLFGLTPKQLIELHNQCVLEEITEDRRRAEVADQFAFFNHPTAAADLHRFIQAPYWTAQECIALSLRKDPTKVDIEKLELAPKNSPFSQLYKTRLDHLQRAIAIGELSERIRPAEFAEWAALRWPNLPDALLELVTHRKVALEQEELDRLQQELSNARSEIESLRKRVSDETSPSGTRLKTLYRIVVGMAVDSYDFCHPGPTDAVKLIENALRRLSQENELGMVEVGNDKIREWLRRAANEVELELPTPIKSSQRSRVERKRL